MKRIALSLLACLYASQLTAKVDEQQLKLCAAETNASNRLACYDSLANMLTTEKPKIQNLLNGKWSSFSKESSNGKNKDIHLSIQSETPIQFNGDTIYPLLTVSCKASKTNVSLNWKIYIGRGSIRMQTHFDNQSDRSQIWTISNGGEAIEVSGSDISFAKKMMRHEKSQY